MIYIVTGWLEITQYKGKSAISITILVETTWLTRSPRPMEAMYEQESEFICCDFRNYLIKREYGITAKPSTSKNTASNTILERIHQVLGNLVRNFNITKTHVEKDEPWTGIFS